MKLEEEQYLLANPYDFLDEAETYGGLGWLIKCPVPNCGGGYNHFESGELITSKSNYVWVGRGHLLVLKFSGECGHKWEMCIGYHEGNNFLYARFKEEKKIDYKEYIQSAEWKAIAEAAKQRAGHRCQVCNSPDKLNTHHRTYENLGREEPGDLFVLCHSCHELFSKNGKLKR